MEKQDTTPTVTPASMSATDGPSPLPEGVAVPGRARAESREAQEEARKEAALEAFARDHEGLSEKDELDALDAILGGRPPAVYTIPVDYETERGTARLWWDVKPQDARTLERLERSATNQTTGETDLITADALVVAEATVALRSATGRTIDIRSREFLTLKRRDESGRVVDEMQAASPADALEVRFARQWGLVAGVAAEIRRISGYDRSKVGSAQRRIVAATGNS